MEEKRKPAFPLSNSSQTVGIHNDVMNKNSNLASFTVPRDLTLRHLTPRGTNKKVYTPNLNVIRNKNSNVRSSTNTSAFQGREEFNKGKLNSLRKNHSNRDSLIQTTGVFSDGVGAANIRKGTSRYGASVDLVRKSTISKKENNRTDPVVVKQYLKNINDLADGCDEENKTILENVPIKLTNGCGENLKQKLNNSYATLKELLSYKQSQLFLLQLPDSLPCQNLVISNTMHLSENDPFSENESFLKQCEEGHIGKILKYKSGKYKLILGSTYYDLDMGMATGYLQEVISATTNREEWNGNIRSLGNIEVKITIIPDWQKLF